MVDLKQNPFFLDDDAAKWVEDTINGMTLKEKLCQLMVDPFVGMTPDEVRGFVKQWPIGGSPVRAFTFDVETGQQLISDLQCASKIPMLFAGNNEAGANGTLQGATLVASGSAVRATRNAQNAYQVGAISSREIAAAGYNCNWGPVGDVLTNWRNTLINARAYGPDADFVSECVEGFNRGCLENGVLPCLKHFPGDGREERDQHLVVGNNDLTCEQWDATFGKIYSTAIANGVPMIMAAHFTMPAYQQRFNPGLSLADMQPACTSPELIGGLLRGQLGYNGIIITDQTRMMGYYAMPRRDALVQTIAVGCDMILGINNIEEDYAALLAGVEDGRLTEERLHDALARILGGKAMLGLHKRTKEDFAPDKAKLACIGCEAHASTARQIADDAITLVKNTRGQLPLKPVEGKKLGFILLRPEQSGHKNVFSKGVASGGSDGVKEAIVAALESAGFEPEEILDSTRKGYEGKTAEMSKHYSAVIIFADITGFAQTNHLQLTWPSPMSGLYPWYAFELPTVFVSLNYTNHLYDVPRVPVFVNAYNDKPDTISLVVDKLTGKSEFKGKYDEQVWCDSWDTKL